MAPLVLKDIEEIRPLPPPPVEIDVSIYRTSADKQSVDVLFTFNNTSDARVTIATNYVQIGLLDYRPARPNRNPDEDSHISKENGYTARQLLFGFAAALASRDSRRRVAFPPSHAKSIRPLP